MEDETEAGHARSSLLIGSILIPATVDDDGFAAGLVQK